MSVFSPPLAPPSRDSHIKGFLKGSNQEGQGKKKNERKDDGNKILEAGNKVSRQCGYVMGGVREEEKKMHKQTG